MSRRFGTFVLAVSFLAASQLAGRGLSSAQVPPAEGWRLKIEKAVTHRFGDEDRTEGLFAVVRLREAELAALAPDAKLRVQLNEELHGEWYVVGVRGYVGSEQAMLPVPMKDTQIRVNRPVNREDPQRITEVELLDLDPEENYAILVFLFPRKLAKAEPAAEMIQSKDGLAVTALPEE